MLDQDETKQALIAELAEMRQRVAVLETAEAGRKRAEEALRRSEERFRVAFEEAPMGMMIAVGSDGIITRVNHALCAITGYAPEELVGMEMCELTHPEDREQCMPPIRKVLAGQLRTVTLESRYLGKDGQVFWARATHAAVHAPDRGMVFSLGILEDITERMRIDHLMLEREAELVGAERIQKHLLPRLAPCAAGYDIAGALLPADFAAGDYYDFLRMPDGSLGVVVGDVSGHGFSAALLMASISAHLRSFSLDNSDIGDIVRHVNTLLCQEIEEGHFVTLVFVQIELAARRLKFVNLGHPAGCVMGRCGEMKGFLPSGALPLAILPNMDIAVSGHIEIEPEDIIILATDGIMEARSPDGVEFGTTRMLEVVRANRGRPASEIVASILQAVFAFTGLEKPQDDLTAVVIKVEAIPA